MCGGSKQAESSSVLTHIRSCIISLCVNVDVNSKRDPQAFGDAPRSFLPQMELDR